jgi:excisionase family DNA binding protein
LAVIGNTYYTLDEAAKTLGIHYLTLWRRVRRYNIPTTRAGWTILVKLEDIQQLPQKESNHACTRERN